MPTSKFTTQLTINLTDVTNCKYPNARQQIITGTRGRIVPFLKLRKTLYRILQLLN